MPCSAGGPHCRSEIARDERRVRLRAAPQGRRSWAIQSRFINTAQATLKGGHSQ